MIQEGEGGEGGYVNPLCARHAQRACENRAEMRARVQKIAGRCVGRLVAHSLMVFIFIQGLLVTHACVDDGAALMPSYEA